MNYVVISAFQDKFSKVHFAIGDVYGSDDVERIAFLQEEGFLGDKVQDEPEQKEEVNSEPVQKEVKGKKNKLKPPETPPNE